MRGRVYMGADDRRRRVTATLSDIVAWRAAWLAAHALAACAAIFAEPDPFTDAE